MSNWNTDMSMCPKGVTLEKTKVVNGKEVVVPCFKPQWLFLANKDGKSYFTHYLQTGRVSGWCEGDIPLAWLQLPEPYNEGKYAFNT